MGQGKIFLKKRKKKINKGHLTSRSLNLIANPCPAARLLQVRRLTEYCQAGKWEKAKRGCHLCKKGRTLFPDLNSSRR